MVTTEGYPTLELPVARFTRPEDKAYYQGASALANLVLRQTIDHAPADSPSVGDLLAARNLWIMATFEDRRQRSMHTDIQVRAETLWLTAGSGQRSFAMRWTQRPSGAYVPDMVKQEDPVLPYPGDQKPLEITPQTYDALPTHNQFQTDPALRFDAAFSHYEKGLEVSHPFSVRSISIRPLFDM